MALNEDTLVQQTTADYLRDVLGWRSEYAYSTEVLGPEGSFGRASEKDVVLTRILGEKLIALNPGIPPVAYQDALRQLVDIGAGKTGMTANREKYRLLRDGVKVEFRKADGSLDARTLRVFDLRVSGFLCVEPYTAPRARKDVWRRRTPGRSRPNCLTRCWKAATRRRCWIRAA